MQLGDPEGWPQTIRIADLQSALLIFALQPANSAKRNSAIQRAARHTIDVALFHDSSITPAGIVEGSAVTFRVAERPLQFTRSLEGRSRRA